MNPVAVIGMAASTHLGLGVESFLAGLRDPLRWSNVPQREPDRALPKLVEVPGLRELLSQTRCRDPLTQQLLAAAVHDLGVHLDRLDEDARDTTGVVLGNSGGQLATHERFYRTGSEEGYRALNPVEYPVTLANYPATQLSRAFSLRGENTTLSSGFRSGTDAIGHGARRLGMGKGSTLVVGGVDIPNEGNLRLLERTAGLSEADPMRCLHERLTGTIPSFGVGLLLLQEASKASANEPCLAEVAGYARSNNGSLEANASAILEALDTAKRAPSGVDAIFTSANGGANDPVELDLLHSIWGAQLSTIPIFSIKEVAGECMTAAGPLQCIAAIGALQLAASRKEPSESRSPRSGLLVPRNLWPCEHPLVYSFDYDGSLSALVLEKPMGPGANRS